MQDITSTGPLCNLTKPNTVSYVSIKLRIICISEHMEIRDPVHGSIDIPDTEALVLDSLAFQRLRQIKQLGFAEFSFPGATHNRYLHSVGATHVAAQMFDSIFKNYKFSSSGVRERFRKT